LGETVRLRTLFPVHLLSDKDITLAYTCVYIYSIKNN